jgi:hypothetical protein
LFQTTVALVVTREKNSENVLRKGLHRPQPMYPSRMLGPQSRAF